VRADRRDGHHRRRPSGPRLAELFALGEWLAGSQGLVKGHPGRRRIRPSRWPDDGHLHRQRGGGCVPDLPPRSGNAAHPLQDSQPPDSSPSSKTEGRAAGTRAGSLEAFTEPIPPPCADTPRTIRAINVLEAKALPFSSGCGRRFGSVFRLQGQTAETVLFHPKARTFVQTTERNRTVLRPSPSPVHASAARGPGVPAGAPARRHRVVSSAPTRRPERCLPTPIAG